LAVGAGYLNTSGAVNLAANVNALAPPSSYWLLNNGLNLSWADDISGYRAVWGGTIIWDEGIYSGNSISYAHRAWASTIVWGDTIIWDEMNRVFGSTIVWEEDVNSLNVLINGQTIVWDVVEALNADDVDPEW
jgi:hypothetical protein